ncbi:hypothetical protein A5M85_12390 [Cellulophaga lytica]|uniref:hypothetical protein n=1 Tax=Cellulophaga lytica TaxID=979 RepID=UPI0009508AF6|nr:hypothetical protein [Cellulophaga lytica]APU11053.1 hypothetical protein A5M85_12390 [Cellulophaga lytica]
MKKSNSINLFKTDLDDIFETALNISLYRLINPSLFKNSNIEPNVEEQRIYERLKNFSEKNLIFNHLLVNVISIMESYLHNVLIEGIKSDHSKTIKFVESYNFQKSITIKDVIEGPESLTINTLNNIIYHNLPKVNNLFKTIFGLDILNIPNSNIRTIFAIIKVRHSIVHDSNRVNGKKFYISSYTFIDYMDIITNWLLDIDCIIMNDRFKKRKTDYSLRFHKELNHHATSPIIEQGTFQLLNDIFNDKNKLFDKKKDIRL